MTSNIDRIIPRLLKRHTRLRSRVRIDGYKHYLDLLDYDEHALAANLFYSIVYDDADDGKAWQRIAEERSNRNPYSPDGSTVFPLFHFALVLNRGDPDRFHLILLVNHCASDGQSGYVLLNEFLSFATSSTWEDQDEPLNKEVLPCIANMIPKPLGPAFSIIASIGRRWYKRIVSNSIDPSNSWMCLQKNEERFPETASAQLQKRTLQHSSDACMTFDCSLFSLKNTRKIEFRPTAFITKISRPTNFFINRFEPNFCSLRVVRGCPNNFAAFVERIE